MISRGIVALLDKYSDRELS